MARKKRDGALQELLETVDARLAKKRPDARAAMKKGASDDALKKLEKAIGAKVAEDLATFFRWHDGQSKIASLHGRDNRTPISIDAAIEAWTFLSDPSEDVKQPWKKSWLPIFENGSGDYLCFDLETGSLVEYWHADDDRKVAFASLGAWAKAAISALDEEKDAVATAAKGKVTLDARDATWTKVKKAITEKQAAKKPVGTMLWYRKELVEGQGLLLYAFVRVDANGEKPWRKVENEKLDLAGGIAKLQAYFDREKPPPEDWWKATDWDVGYACEEDVFNEENPAPEGMFEGVIQIRVG